MNINHRNGVFVFGETELDDGVGVTHHNSHVVTLAIHFLLNILFGQIMNTQYDHDTLEEDVE